MASPMVKDIADTASKYVTTSLDNVKDFIDRTADEIVKADLIGANRRLADQVIEGAKSTANRVADTAAQADTMEAVRKLATESIEFAQQTFKMANEETQRLNLASTGSKLTQESLDLLRRQFDLSMKASKELGEVVSQYLPFKGVPARGTKPTVTRVEIDSDKETLKAESTTH